jgi:hypothetical protein
MNESFKHLFSVGEGLAKSYITGQTAVLITGTICGAVTAVLLNNPNHKCYKKIVINGTTSTVETSCYDTPPPKPSNRVNPGNAVDNTSHEKDLLTLDRKFLFEEGKYFITDLHRNALKEIDPQLNILEMQGKTVTIQGLADAKGNNFIKVLEHQYCGNERFENIYYRPFDGNQYAKQLSPYTIGERYNNFDLSLLRARSYQCLLKATHPLLKTEILAGGVQPVVGSEYRRVRLSFLHNKLREGDITPP